jgi:hypothetical protein
MEMTRRAKFTWFNHDVTSRIDLKIPILLRIFAIMGQRKMSAIYPLRELIAEISNT